ncbi:MAG: glutamine-hydrolyzing GMP synthase [Anaerolineales bacterium]
MHHKHNNSIAVIDFGSQYSQLIVRRVREASVYCELFPYTASETEVLSILPKGFILSGGPASAYDHDAPMIPTYILDSDLPILGICYGMQALVHQLGGEVASSSEREYGSVEVVVHSDNLLLPKGQMQVWMSHGDRISKSPAGYEILASSNNSPNAAIGNFEQRRFGLQFHPEVHHTPKGPQILEAFILQICGAEQTWTPPSIIDESLRAIADQIGNHEVIAGVSGGVDSTVAAALVDRAVGDQLTCIFIDTGMLRSGEAEEVVETFDKGLGSNFIAVNASETFLEALSGITDPELKRKIIGEKFIRVFEEQAAKVSDPRFLVQGTIYPDVVESSAPDRNIAARIKTHHNVGGLPSDIQFEIVEPLRYLFKDEVRKIGSVLGIPDHVLWRQPFPGPGLAVRCIGEIKLERLETLRAADKIVVEELQSADLLKDETAQAFAVLLPIRSVGVMGDQRTYAHTIAVRVVTSEDFMTADWARIPYEILARISNRIVNEVAGINRVVYDISSKPPATIEWE